MSLIRDMSRFAVNPTSIDIQRSRFDRASSIKFTGNVGQLIPFYVDEVLPGDTFQIDTSKVVRLQTLLTPIMDNLYLDVYWFFVPNRLVWSHWQEFCGENSQSAWIPQTEYSIPQLTAPAAGWSAGTIADYMGIPTGVSGLSVNALPFRAYALVVDEWFRDQNLQDPLNISVSDATQQGVNTGNYVTDCALGGLPFVAAKYHDYFTSCLPSPQKGPDVLIPVADAANYPVVPLAEKVPSSLIGSQHYTASGIPDTDASNFGIFFDGSGQQVANYGGDFKSGSSGSNIPIIDNLWAVASGNAQAATINQLRLAFQIQRLYERDARGGTRYIELLKSHFGVTSPDARLQRPEYLGGNRVPLTVEQVVQQSETGTTPQGGTTGMSLTTDVHSDFTKSFVEHGILLGLCVVRYHHTYQQGIERMWSRKTRFDYYWPALANIGEQAVLNKEIFAQGTDEDEEVFGYQEAWADYRYKPNRVAGEMRSAYAQSLDVWHLGDDYESLPTLSPDWIQEDAATVNRVLAVSDSVSNQLLFDIYVQNRTTRPMPLYSIPGLIDHN